MAVHVALIKRPPGTTMDKDNKRRAFLSWMEVKCFQIMGAIADVKGPWQLVGYLIAPIGPLAN